jgi:hypothetical protein
MKASWLKFNGKFILRCPHNHPVQGDGRGGVWGNRVVGREPLASGHNPMAAALSFMHLR